MDVCTVPPPICKSMLQSDVNEKHFKVRMIKVIGKCTNFYYATEKLPPKLATCWPLNRFPV